MNAAIQLANALGDQWWAIMWPALWQSTALALIIYLVSKAPHAASPSIRFWLWMLVPLRLLVMPLMTVPLPVLPAIQDVPPAARVSVPVVESRFQPLPDEPLRTMPTPPDRGIVARVPAAAVSCSGAAAVPFPRVQLSAWLMLGWLVGVGVVAVRMGRGMLRLRRLCAEGRSLTDAKALEVAHRAARLAGLDRLPRIILTGESVSPFACGIASPVVVLPERFLASVPQAGLLAVLAHEFVHLRRRDSLTGTILAACEALYFFHPVVHFAKRRILFERERACDDSVLAISRARPNTYARALLLAAEGVRTVRPYPAPAAVTMESFKDLKERLVSIAHSSVRHAALTRRALAVLAALTVVCLPGIALTPSGGDPTFELLASARPARARTGGARTARVRSASVPADSGRSLGAVAEPATASRGRGRVSSASRDASTASVDEPVAQTRVIHFPEEHSLGTVEIVTRGWRGEYRLGYGSDYFAGRTYLADAWGDVTVPADAHVWLVVGYGLLGRMEALADLEPNDLFGLRVEGTEKYPCPNPDVAIMPHLAHLTGLRDLELGGLDVTSRGLEHLHGLTNLEYLYLRSKKLDEGALAKLGHMTKLRQLLLFSPVTDQDLVDIAKLRSLRELKVLASNMRGHGLLHLADLPDLRYLAINGTGPGPDVVRHVATIKTLRSLRFQGNMPLTDESVADLAALKDLEELEFIWIQTLTDAAMPHIAKMRKLRKLDLHQTMVTDAGLERLRYMPNLEDLHLPKGGRGSEAELTDAALAHVAEVKGLRRLNAQGSFTDTGLRYISNLPELRELLICTNDTAISDAGIAQLTRLNQLESLHLICDGPTEALTASLAQMPALEDVDLMIGRPGFITISAISRLNALTKLRHLDAYRVVQDGSGLDLSALKNLEWLSLNIVAHEGRRAEGAVRDEDLACLANLTNLRCLGLNTSPTVTDAGLAHLRNLHGLYQFHVGGPRVTDTGLACVADMSNLHIVTLTGAFSDNGIMKLRGLDNLTHLTVNTSLPVGNALAPRLCRELPNLYSISGLPGCDANIASGGRSGG
ncbi:MAG: M48 family metalloprotease [bacterium]|nr:M48 family metalloprotease [bacterium]